MNIKFCILILAIVLSFGGNVWAQNEMHGSHHGKEEAKHEHSGDEKSHKHDEAALEKTVYTCPMHPEVKQNEPGKCPKCGMNLEMMSKADEEKIMEKDKEKAPEPASHDMHGMSGHKH